MRPSFIGLSTGAILLTVGAVIMWINWRRFSPVDAAGLLLLLSIAVSAHSLLHANEEVNFGWNPLIGKMAVRDSVVWQ
jgi:hypothetical protein